MDLNQAVTLKNTLRKVARVVFPKKRVVKISKLRKEASIRDFYRIRFGGGATCIAMILSTNEDKDQLSQIIREATQVFEGLKISVPKLYGYFEEENIFILKDVGKFSLDSLFIRYGKKTMAKYYKQVLDKVLRYQLTKPNANIENLHPFKVSFTFEKFRSELDFFYKNSHLQRILSEQEQNTISELFDDLCHHLINLPTALNHRDLHSRNIIVLNNEVNLIDHQDARIGPIQYDLVSLIKDSYVGLSHRMELELVSYYLDQAKIVYDYDFSFEEFFRGYYLCMMQRSLKACGTFYYQYRVAKNMKFKKWIIPAINHAMDALKKVSLNLESVNLLDQKLLELSEEE